MRRSKVLWRKNNRMEKREVGCRVRVRLSFTEGKTGKILLKR